MNKPYSPTDVLDRPAPRRLDARGSGGNRPAARTRITVHAFCEDQATAAAISHAATDPRLARAKVSVDMGGLPAACALFAKTPTPNLIIVESQQEGGGVLAALEQLADVCDAETKVIVIGHINDVRLYRELLRRHISDYLVAPLPASLIADSIAGVINGQAVAQTGRVVAFFGAKGGCGSSMVCHNTAWAIAETLETETVIADFDLAFGTLGLDFNQDSARGMGDALAVSARLDAAMIDKLLLKCSHKLSLLTPPCALDRDLTIAPEAAVQVVELLGQTVPFVALDMPRVWNAWTQRLIAHADDIVITAEPDLASLRNAKNLVDTIRAARVSARPPLVVLNKMNTPRRPEIALRDFVNAVDMQPVAMLDFDAQLFGTAANNGLMIAEIAARSTATGVFRELAAIVTGKALPAQQRTESFFAPLINKLSRRHAE